MKLKALKSYVGGDVEGYLRTDLASAFREIMLVARRISFADNFEAFESSGVIAAGEELGFRNELNFIPSRRLVLRQSGGGAIIDGDTPWNINNLYLKNTGTDDATVTVVFMR